MGDPQDLPDPLVSARPDWMGGTPCFHGTRVPVKTLFDYLSKGYPLSEFLVDFPSVTHAHAAAVIAAAGKVVPVARSTEAA